MDTIAISNVLEDRLEIENYCRSFLLTKQGSVDESFLQTMVSAVSKDIYLHITKDSITKDFVNRFSTQTGNRCKDGQIEVKCMIKININNV